MRKRIKRSVSVLLVFALVLIMPTTAMAKTTKGEKVISEEKLSKQEVKALEKNNDTFSQRKKKMEEDGYVLESVEKKVLQVEVIGESSESLLSSFMSTKSAIVYDTVIYHSQYRQPERNNRSYYKNILTGDLDTLSQRIAAMNKPVNIAAGLTKVYVWIPNVEWASEPSSQYIQ